MNDPDAEPFRYLRLREPPYTDDDLRAVAATIRDPAYVYVRHEDEPTAPATVERLKQLPIVRALVWVARELLRFVGRDRDRARLIAIVIAEARALISGGDTIRTFRIVLHPPRLPLSAARGRPGRLARRPADERHELVDHVRAWAGRSCSTSPGPKMTATAVFIGSGLVLLVLGVAL